VTNCRRLVLGFVFLWFFIGGIMHFTATDFFAGIIPLWLPQHRLLVQISGVFELLGAAGIVLAPVRKWAGWGLVLLTIAVTPANIFMWQHAQDYPVPLWVLTLRLPFQAVLLLGIWWSTRLPRSADRPGVEPRRADGIN
jgi:uncharacterized membrane protein